MSERASTKGRDDFRQIRRLASLAKHSEGPRNATWIEGETAFIQLTQGEVAAIDAADLSLLSGLRVVFHRNRPRKYALVCLRKSYCLPLHRLLMQFPDNLHVDHIDGNGLNNRRANLRVATPAQNSWNTGLKRTNTSGHKGVSWRADRGKWQVHIRANGRRLSLGHYDDLQVAAKAYAEAARNLHGEFASLGKPEAATHATPNPLSEGRERS